MPHDLQSGPIRLCKCGKPAMVKRTVCNTCRGKHNPPEKRKCSQCNEEKVIREFRAGEAPKEDRICRSCRDARKDFFAKNRHSPMSEQAPYRRLAAAVILGAFHVINKGVSPWKREAAKQLEREIIKDAKWFLESDMRPFASVLDLDIEGSHHWRNHLKGKGMRPNRHRFEDGRELS
jgi:RecJ-like exonuclease